MDESTFNCFSSYEGSTGFLVTTDHAGSQHRLRGEAETATPIRPITGRPWLLRSSPCRFPWACLAVGLPWNSQGGVNFQRLFHVPRSSQDGLGPLSTPAVRHSRRATLESPNLTAYHFGPSLDQPRWLVLGDDACECLMV